MFRFIALFLLYLFALFALEVLQPVDTYVILPFTAAIVARMLESAQVSPTMDDVRYAAAAGALATTRHGAWEGLPTRAQLEAFLAPA